MTAPAPRDQVRVAGVSSERVAAATAPADNVGLRQLVPVPALRARRTAAPSVAAGRVDPIGMIRRAPLDAAGIIAAVDAVPGLQGRLDQQTAAQRRDQRIATKDDTVRDRLRAVLAQQHAMFGRDDALSMAIAVDWAAKVAAEELYDASLKPQIASHLFDVFADRIKAAMPNKGRRTKDLAKAKVVVSTDALSLYLHEERALADAAWDIHDAAAAGRLTPQALFDLLLQKFQAEMATETFDTTAAQTDQRGTYNQSESTGNVSTNYLKELFGDAIEGTPAVTMPKRVGNAELAFNPATDARIAALRNAVVATTVAGAVDPRPTDAPGRRRRLFDDLTAKDAADQLNREQAVAAALQAAPWSLAPGKTAKVIAKLKSGMKHLPLTVTHRAKDRVPIDTDVDAVNRSRAGQFAAVDVEGRGFNSPGAYTGDDVNDRGADYMQFRSWKDRKMTGNTGMSGAEMPVFGAVNVNWKKYKGTESTELGDKGTDKTARKQNRSDWVGENYYGGMHLVLDRKAVAGRVVYTATDHGQPHVDPFLAFADFLVGSSGAYQADVTRLKRPGVPGFNQAFAVQRPEFAQMVVATILGSMKAAAVNLPFEVMIHGGVNWETDVKEIWLSPRTKRQYVAKLETWSKAAKGRPKIKIIEPPEDGIVSTRAGLAASGVKRAKKA